MKIKRIIALLLSFVIAVSFLTSCADIDVEGILQEVETILQEEASQTESQNETDISSDTGNEQKTPDAAENDTEQSEPLPDENGVYTSKDDVALYIRTYGRLPSNFITKDEARALGWDGGSLEPYAPGKSIGGDYFGNYEGLLPEKKGRKYTECDIDTAGKSSRGEKRIVFSNDGLIYYTDDHYESFTLLYGEE